MCNPIMKDTYLATTQLHCLSSKLRHHQLLLNRMNCMYVLVVFLKPRQIYGLFLNRQIFYRKNVILLFFRRICFIPKVFLAICQKFTDHKITAADKHQVIPRRRRYGLPAGFGNAIECSTM